jgi:hypothetical protein
VTSGGYEVVGQYECKIENTDGDRKVRWVPRWDIVD